MKYKNITLNLNFNTYRHGHPNPDFHSKYYESLHWGAHVCIVVWHVNDITKKIFYLSSSIFKLYYYIYSPFNTPPSYILLLPLLSKFDPRCNQPWWEIRKTNDAKENGDAKPIVLNCIFSTLQLLLVLHFALLWVK